MTTRPLLAVALEVVTIHLVLLIAGSSPALAARIAPDASFGAFPADPVTGQPVRFVSYACDPDGSLVERAWDLDGDGEFDDSSAASFRHAYATPGTRVVRLRATDDDGLASVRSRSIDVRPGIAEYVVPRPFRPPMLSPFPVVRLAGEIGDTGVTITRLTVRAPVCATAAVRCRGESCPFRRLRRVVGRRIVRFRQVERRRLEAGVRLEVTVRKRDRIGKYTRFVIREGRAPRRLDACLRFRAARPSRCPRD